MRGRPRSNVAGTDRDVRARRPGQGACRRKAWPRTHPGVPQREDRMGRVRDRHVPQPGRTRLRSLGPAGTAPVQSRFQTNRSLEGLQRSRGRLPVRRHLRALVGVREGNQMSNHTHEETGSMTSPYAARIRAIEALLLEKGVLTAPEVHNLIVCTLCSCYPRAILGRPPDWYKSFAYRSRAVSEPRAVMREFGFEPPEGVEIVVHDSTADVRYMVLPMRPCGTEGMDEEQFAEFVTRDSLVGVNVPLYPGS